jgi:hypothetical protein
MALAPGPQGQHIEVQSATPARPECAGQRASHRAGQRPGRRAQGALELPAAAWRSARGPCPCSLPHLPGAETDIEVGIPVPVAEGGVGEGRVAAGELPGGTVASAWHLGAHDRLGDAYAGLQAWLQQYGHQPQGAGWRSITGSTWTGARSRHLAGPVELAHTARPADQVAAPHGTRTATPATGPPHQGEVGR